jgi:hypothetical protein
VIDQIVFFQRKDHVREKSQHVITAKFKDRSTAALVVPTNIKYRIDCLSTGTAVLDWTTVSADDEITLTITATQNAMQDQFRAYEIKELTVAADYGLATQFVESVTYHVENLRGVS